MKVHVRWMIRRDMTSVLEIENGDMNYPWSENDFIRCLRHRNCIGMVAEHDDQVVGYIIYELRKRKLHLIKLVVRRDCRRQGVGRQMVDKLIGKLIAAGRNFIELKVRETSLDAQLFFRSYGFVATTVNREWFCDPDEDAYSMELHVTKREMDKSK